MTLNQRTGAEQRQCAANCAAGGRCMRFVDVPRDFCRMHDPAHADARREASAKAGTICGQRVRRRKRRNPSPISLRTSSEIMALQERAAALLANKPTDRQIAQGNALTRLVTAAAGTLRVAELERQVETLRAQLERALGNGDDQ